MFRSMPMEIRRSNSFVVVGGTISRDLGRRSKSTGSLLTSSSSGGSSSPSRIHGMSSSDHRTRTANTTDERSILPSGVHHRFVSEKGDRKRDIPGKDPTIRTTKTPESTIATMTRREGIISSQRHRRHHHPQKPSSSSLSMLKRWDEPILPYFVPHKREEGKRFHLIVSHKEGRNSLSDVLHRLYECFRVLSIHARFYDSPIATATLLTMERIEIRLKLMMTKNTKKKTTTTTTTKKTGSTMTTDARNRRSDDSEELSSTSSVDIGNDDEQAIQLEMFRVKGDAMAFHRYAKLILRAARGEFLPPAQEEQRHDSSDHPADLSDEAFRSMSRGHHRTHRSSVLALQNMLQSQLFAITPRAHLFSVAATEIAFVSDLIAKDRLDARMLGLENLALLTDPIKSTRIACIMASQIVLFGKQRWPQQEEELEGEEATKIGGAQDQLDEQRSEAIRRALLEIAQSRQFGDATSIFHDVMMMDDYDSDDDDYEYYEDRDDIGGASSSRPLSRYYLECMETAVNLVLTIISNSWENIIIFGILDDPTQNPSDITDKNRTSTTGTSKIGVAMKTFLNDAFDITSHDFVGSMIGYARNAERSPHNAMLAVKTLRLLGELSPDDILDKAAATTTTGRTHPYDSVRLALSSAMEVGTACHAQLEGECHGLEAILSLQSQHADESRQ